jgi:NADPH:quinone reductase-like Zn-dependent oxidoreductase
MKALRFSRFGSPDVLQLVDLPTPLATGSAAVIQVVAAAVAPGDVESVAGAMEGTVLPRTPGRDFTGVVVDGARKLLGQAVWGTSGSLGVTRDGTHAEYVQFPVAGLRARPETLTPEQAAAVPFSFITAWRGLLDCAQLRGGETVIVFGVSGGVGAAATQLAHWRGARVIGVDVAPPSDNVDARARPDLVFIRPSAYELVAAVRDATQGQGAAVGFDAVGGSEFDARLETIAHGGRLVVMASVGERRVSFDLIDFYRRELRLFGVDPSNVNAAEAGRILELLELGFLTGLLRPPPIGARFPLARAREAYEAVARGDAGGRVVLVPQAKPSPGPDRGDRMQKLVPVNS